MFVRCTNPSYPCGEGDHNCINASSFFVPQAVMTYANVDYDPSNATTLINSLDLLWVKSNQCNRASPWFWLVRDCSDLLLVLGIALFALSEKQSPSASRLCGPVHDLPSAQRRSWTAALASSVGLEVSFLVVRLCADVLALVNNDLLFCFLGLAYFVETDMFVLRMLSGIRVFVPPPVRPYRPRCAA